VTLDVFLTRTHEGEHAGDLTDFDLSELLAAVQAGEMTETVRLSLSWVLQQLIEAELTATIGAAPGQRADSRVTQRTGTARS
jgi:putative transposase